MVEHAPSCACGGGCPRCQAKSSLKIGEPGDAYEREADAVADSVVRMADPDVTPSHAGVQRKFAAEPSSASTPNQQATAPSSALDALNSPGTPLAAEARGFFEARFGHDFSDVRLHTGTAAEQSARDMHALAYTIGTDIVFGAGQFAPGRQAGQRLIAHELAHVVQQGRSKHPVIQRQLIFGNGYTYPYATEQEETGSIVAKTWMPASIDFEHTAARSGGGRPAATLTDLFAEIGSYNINSITELGLIGHGGGGGFGLSGSYSFSPPGWAITDLITSQTLEKLSSKYLFVRDRFTKDAALTFYSCSSGADQTFMDNLSQAFGVCVKGFSSAILWCVASNQDGSIADRGRTILGPPPTSPGCTGYQANIKSLTPDVTSCMGAPKEATTPAVTK